MVKHYTTVTLGTETRDKLEELRVAKAARSLAAVVTELTDRAHARIKENKPLRSEK